MPFRLLETAPDSGWSAEGVRPTLNVRMDARLVPSAAYPEGAFSDIKPQLCLHTNILDALVSTAVASQSGLMPERD